MAGKQPAFDGVLSTRSEGIHRASTRIRVSSVFRRTRAMSPSQISESRTYEGPYPAQQQNGTEASQRYTQGDHTGVIRRGLAVASRPTPAVPCRWRLAMT